MALSDLAQYVANAIALGSIYALVAIGYNVVYGIVKLMNMSHASIFMLASFLAMWGVYRYSIPMWISFPVALLVVAALNVVIESVAYRPLRGFRISAYTSAVAVGVMIENFVVFVLTSVPKGFPRPGFVTGVFDVRGITLPMVTLITIPAAAILFLSLFYLTRRTRIGKAMRAISEDMETASLMGVEVNRVISFAFGLSAVYAAAGAFLWGWRFPVVTPFIGAMPGLKAFIAAVMGGIGSLTGSLVGGFVLGLAEVMLVAVFPRLSGWRDALAYILLIAFLLLRPGGIFNIRLEEEKV